MKALSICKTTKYFCIEESFNSISFVDNKITPVNLPDTHTHTFKRLFGVKTGLKR